MVRPECGDSQISVVTIAGADPFRQSNCGHGGRIDSTLVRPRSMCSMFMDDALIVLFFNGDLHHAFSDQASATTGAMVQYITRQPKSISADAMLAVTEETGTTLRSAVTWCLTRPASTRWASWISLTVDPGGV